MAADRAYSTDKGTCENHVHMSVRTYVPHICLYVHFDVL